MSSDPSPERWLSSKSADAPPRSNGELVFDEPWQSRTFGMAVALRAAGSFTWDEFRTNLIAAIADAPDLSYYEQWLLALEAVLDREGVVDRTSIRGRAVDLRAAE